MSGSAGKTKQSSSGNQQSSGGSISNTFLDPLQQPFLQSLREQAMGQLGGSLGAGGEWAQQAREMFNQGQGLIGQLSGATGGVIDQFGGDIARQLQRQIGGAGGINSQAQLAGALGGGRNQVMQGIAQEGALNAFGQGAANLRLAGTQGALSAMPGLLNMGMSGMGAQWAPLQALAGIIGDPTVLSSSRSWDQSTGTTRGKGSSWNLSGGSTT